MIKFFDSFFLIKIYSWNIISNQIFKTRKMLKEIFKIKDISQNKLSFKRTIFLIELFIFFVFAMIFIFIFNYDIILLKKN